MAFLALVIIFCISSSPAVSAEKQGQQRSGFFIFGDSSIDPGNNNHIETIPENRANYKPYGRNGFFKEPTGRFSDGRIIVDFLAEYADLPIIPPYLMDPSADFSYGVNFGSGGAGVLSSTNEGQAIDLNTQMKYFDRVQKLLEEKRGVSEAGQVVSNAVYFFSIGSNDYLGGYLGSAKMQERHSPEEYIGMVIGNLTGTIQELYAKGARKFGFLSLSPLGCLPVLRAINPNASQEKCFEQANALAVAHNNALKSVVSSLEYLYKDFKYCNSDFYSWLQDRMDNPFKYDGLKEGERACCGTGPYNGVYTCGEFNKKHKIIPCILQDLGITNGKTSFTIYEYVWWDSYHPTERIHQEFAKALWDGPKEFVGPYNLRDLFFISDDEKKKIIVADNVDTEYRMEAGHQWL